MKHICRIVTAIIIVLTLFITYKINNISTESVQANGSLTIDGEPSKAYFTEHIEYSFEHTSGSGENRLLLVGVSWGRTTTGTLSRKIEKITFDNVDLVMVTQNDQDPLNNVAIYRYPEEVPFEKTANIYIKLLSDNTNVVVGAINFAGVNLSDPFRNTTTNRGDTSTPTLNILTQNGDMVFDTVSTYYTADQSLVADTNQTEQWNEFIVEDISKLGAASTKTAITTQTTMSWIPTYPYVAWAMAAVAIKPVQPTVAGIGDFVWIDRNADGIQDYGEPGLSDVVVDLIQDGGSEPTLTTVTDPEGYYFFESPPPGDYTLKFSHPTIDLAFTLQNQGSDEAVDSDVDANGLTITFTLQADSNNPTVDAGVLMPDNPPLTATCGLDIAFVIDSALTTDENLNTVIAAFQDFTRALLPATPTRIALIDYDTVARVWNFTSDHWDDSASAEDGDYWSSDLSAINIAISSITNDGFTNYENALSDAHTLFSFDSDNNPDLIIFSTRNQPDHTGSDGVPSSETDAMSTAIQKAFYTKSDSIRILSLGIGSNFDINNLTTISGPILNFSPSTSTDVITSDFADLSLTLENLSREMCGGTCTIHNIIDTDGELFYDPDGNIIPEDSWLTEGSTLQDWEYTISYMQPGLSFIVGQDNPMLTGSDGDVIFYFQISNTPTGFDLEETLKNEWQLLDVKCFYDGIEFPNTQITNSSISDVTFSASDEILSCFFYNFPTPTAVKMLSFTAELEGVSVFLHWETATEINNLGFNLYREIDQSGVKEKINSDLIPSKSPGGMEGAMYEFYDDTITTLKPYVYWLEAIDINMRVSDPYGPASLPLWQSFFPLITIDN